MTMTIERFREAAARRKRGVRRGSSGYPEEMRRFAVTFTTESLSGGGTISGAARELGVSEVTLSKWMEKDAFGDRGGGFRKVVVEAPLTTVERGAVTLVSPSGFRVEGLGLESAAALLKTLG